MLGNYNFIVYKKSIWIFFFAFTISFISIFKVPDSDLGVYLDYYNKMRDISFSDLLTNQYLSIRVHEYIFKFYTWSVKNIFYQSWIYVFLSVFIIYHSILKLSFKYVDNVAISRKHIFIILLWCVGVGVTFSTSIHLIRQYLAIALFAYGLIALIDKKYLLLLTLMAFSLMTHYSMFIVCLILIISLMFKSLFISRLKYLNFLAVILISFGFSIFFDNADFIKNFLDGSNYSIPDRESVSFAIMVMDLTIVSLFLYLYRKNYNLNIVLLTSFVVFFIAFLIVIHNYNYLLLRFYFVFDMLRAVLGSLIILKINFTPRLAFIPIAALFFVLYFSIRLYNSPWNFGVYHI